MLRLMICGLIMFLGSQSAFADSEADKIKAKLEKALPGAQIDKVKPTPLPGLYEINLQGQVVYSTEDGRYIFQGDIYDRQASVNLTESARSELRKVAITQISDEQTVVFSPKKPEYSITVFTDTSCGYCRKLHQEIPSLNEQGVKVRYMLYPRAGVGSPSYKTLQGIWCADNQQKAMNDAKSGADVPQKTCDNPIEKHMKAARDFGLQGTPMIVTDKGTVISGYRPADQLLAILKAEKK